MRPENYIRNKYDPVGKCSFQGPCSGKGILQPSEQEGSWVFPCCLRHLQNEQSSNLTPQNATVVLTDSQSVKDTRKLTDHLLQPLCFINEEMEPPKAKWEA